MGERTVLAALTTLLALGCTSAPGSTEAEPATSHDIGAGPAHPRDPGPHAVLDTAVPHDTGRVAHACPSGVAAYVDGVATATVAEALAATVQHSVVEVCAGTWVEPLTLPHTGPVALRAVLGHEGLARLSGGGTHRVLDVPEGAYLRLQDLVLVDGRADRGAGLRARDVAHLVVTDCVFEGHEATSGGGALWIDHAPDRPGDWPLQLERVVVRDSRAPEAGGVHLGATARPLRAHLVDVVVDGNTATDDAGGVRIVGEDVELLWEGGALRGNHADFEAGALRLEHGVTATLVDVAIEDNTAAVTRAAIKVDPRASAAALVLRGGTLAHNHAPGGAALSARPGGIVTLDGVDLGHGPSDNLPTDLDGCPPVDGPAHLVYDPLVDPPCR